MLGLGIGFSAAARRGGQSAAAALDLNFLTGTLDSRIAFSRASSATYADSAGVLQTAATNAPRFDHAITTPIINLLTYSSEFDNAAWTKSNATVTANAALGPDNTLSADKLVENMVSAGHYVEQTVTGAAANHVGSVYAKAGERSRITVYLVDTGGIVAGTSTLFDLSSGTVVQGTGTISSAGDGWYRCAVSGLPAAGSLRLRVILAVGVASSYVSDGISGAFLWGAQLEQSAALGTYIPTSGIPARIGGSTTNLLTYSEQFDNAAWPRVRSNITANAATDPLGGTTADKLTEQTDTATNRSVTQNISVTSGTTYTISVYAKAAERSGINLRFATGFAAGNVTFDLTNLTATPNGTVAGSSITSVGNGWVRCAASYTATSTTTAGAQVFLATTSITYDGVAGNGVYLWGAQVEASPTLGPYVATTTAAATANVTEARGLLIEEARSNLLLRSSEFGATWSAVNLTVTADQTTAPDGTLSGDLLTGTNSTVYVSQNIAVTSGAVVTVSFFAKQAATSWFRLRVGGGAETASQHFNIATGAVGTTTSSANLIISNPILNDAGNGWYRCSAVFTTTGFTTLAIGCGPAPVNGASGAAGNSCHVWGAQVEVGSFPTSYIPTTSATATRAADVANIGTLAPWYNPNEGTVCAEVELPNQALNSVTAVSFGLSSGVFGDSTYLSHTNNGDYLSVANGGVTQATAGVGALLAGVKKVAAAYKLNDFGYSRAGAAAVTDTSGTVSATATAASIGKAPWGSSNYLNGYIRQIRYWPVRRPNADLQSLTS